MKRILISSIIFLILSYVTSAPSGHRSFVFQKCLNLCSYENCTDSLDDTSTKIRNWDVLNLIWSCSDECTYICMWNAVDAYEKDDQPVPQFYGKWPFQRLWGIQEPASVFFSLINCIVNIIMIYKFASNVPHKAPMFCVYYIYGIISTVAWLCAIAFHIRDRTVTEVLDYGGAVSFVFYNIFTVLIRIFYEKSLRIKVSFILPVVTFYLYHIYNLIFSKINYGYNMQVMITAGAMNNILWLAWCYWNKKNKPYVWKAEFTMLLVSAIIPLELYDFPPLLWIFDAHSLWHGLSIPASYMIMSFAMDDALHMIKSNKKE